ncbi:MAG: carboxylating nicotinate-nucleotide diphosphorylase [Planctomycetota bacterium]
MSDVAEARVPEPLDAAAIYDRACRRAGLTDAEVAARFADDVAVDLAPSGVDVTSWAFVDGEAHGDALMRTREAGVLCGAAFLVGGVGRGGLEGLRLELLAEEGKPLAPGDGAARLSGPLRQILTFERAALNLVTHLSGIATLTAKYVEQTRGTKATICDTRKTLPGLRRWQKYAVVCGGGTPHRDGLGDAMLVKDNHLDGVPLEALTATLDRAAGRARAEYPGLKFVEVEVDTLDQLRRVLASSVDLVLLDNMSLEQLREAVAMRDATNPRVGLEASGGVTIDTVAGIAATGVDRISVGALTHSAPSLDLGLDRR